ncbi:MAG: hypothetical protein Q9164_005015 [Protoblastenia rupestris]
MSDLGRKDMGDKAQEKLTPESQKSMGDKVTEGATSAYDKAADAVQPRKTRNGYSLLHNPDVWGAIEMIEADGDKSVTQQLSDSTSTKPGEKGYVAQAQDMASGAAKYVQDTATNVVNKASDTTK